MNFGFTEEQELLRDQVRRFMQDACPMSEVRALMKSATGASPSLWRQAAELGWLGLVIPERFGGVGLKWVDLTVVLEETGRGLSPLPIISQTLAATALLRCGSPTQQQALLPGLADGSRVATLALYDEPNWVHPDAVKLTLSGGGRLKGTKPFVADAGAADLFIVACRSGGDLKLALIERNAPGVSIALQPMMDETKRIGTLTLDCAIDDAQLMNLSLRDLGYLSDCGAVAVMRGIRRRRRGRARDDDGLRQGAHPVRQPDRQVSGRQTPSRRNVRRHRIVQVVVVLRRLDRR